MKVWAVFSLFSIPITHKAKMSFRGFRKNPPDTRKKCTLCNEIGHLASDCTNQPDPAPAPAPAPPPLPAPAPLPPPARSYASAVATPLTPAAARARFDKLVTYPLDPRAAKPSPATAPFRPKNAAPNPAVAQSVPTTAQPATTVVTSPPSAASFRPTTPRSSPSAGPSNPPTTVSSSSSRAAGSFNVDLASIGIELSEEQKSWDPTKQKHEFGIRIGYGTAGKRLPKPEVITNYVKIVKRPTSIGVYELKIVDHTDIDNKEWLVKDKTKKKAIFEQLKYQPGYQSLRDHQNYATDYELIWATGPLFPVDKDLQARLKPRRPSLSIIHTRIFPSPSRVSASRG